MTGCVAKINFLLFFISFPLFVEALPSPSPNTVLSGNYALDNGGGTIDASTLPSLTGYFMQSGALTMSNVTFQNFSTTGGSGSGGGAGLGGVLFINTGVTVTLNNVNFYANSVYGGLGGIGLTGGVLNNVFLSNNPGENGASGGDASTLSAFTNSGNGGRGADGFAGHMSTSSGPGGAGGKGGNGGDGSPTSTQQVTAAGQDAWSIAQTVANATAGAALTSELPAIAATIAAEGAFESDPFLAGFPTATIGADTALAISIGTINTYISVGVGASDIALAAVNAAQLVALETTAYLVSGTSGIGGDGGHGNEGAEGTFGFGGGPGGNGGIGGDAASNSIATGGDGGNAGHGASGGFGGGGGSGGLGGTPGANGSLGPNNGPLEGSDGIGGLGGFGGGNGSFADANGGGGFGFGGALFVNGGGILNITGSGTFSGNNALVLGSSNGGSGGYFAGTDLFMMTGSNVTLNPGAGNTILFEGSIADDSAATLNIFSNAVGSGAGLTVTSGLVIFNGVNTYSGPTVVSGGVVQASATTNANSNINLSGGILQGNGALNRFLGTQPDRIQLTAGGFSSAETNFTVMLNAGQTLTWGSTPYFLPSGTPFYFGSSSATNNVNFTNPIDLGGVNQTILATANANNSNQAILSGILSNGSLTIGDSSHTGTVVLTAANTYMGATQINGGTLILQGSLTSANIAIANSSTLNDINGGLPNSATLTNNGSLILGANNTISSLVSSGSISGTGNTLTAATYLLQNGSNVSANLGTGTLTTTGTVNLSGSSAANNININAASTLNVLGSQLLSSGAAVTVDGTLNVSGSSQTIDILNGVNGTIAANTFQVNGGGTFSGTMNTTSFTVGGASLFLDNVLFSSNSLIIDTAATLTLDSTTATTATTTLNTNSTLDISTNAVLNATTIQQSVGSVILVPNSSQLVYTLLTGNGTVNTLGSTFVNHATITGFETFSNGLENLGVLQPGFSPGLITVNGNYTEGGQLILALNNTTPITGYSQVQVGGTATFLSSSSLEVEMNSSAVIPGNTFQVIANSSGGPIAVNGDVGNISLTINSVAANPQAILFNLGTGQIIVTNVTPFPPNPSPPSSSSPGSLVSLAANANQRRIAEAILNAGLIGSNQISNTIAGLFISEIFVGNTQKNLSFFDPGYYGSMADTAFLGDRALASQVWNRVSVLEDFPCQCCDPISAFAGYLDSHARHVNHSNLWHDEAFAGLNYTICPSASFGAAVSYHFGKIQSSQGNSHLNGVGAIAYLRRDLTEYLTAYGTIACSFLSHDLHRPTLNGEVDANAKTQSVTGYLALQYNAWCCATLSFAPRINFTYSLAHVDAFAEQGAIDALHDNGFSASLFTTEVGFSLVYTPIPEVAIEMIGGLEQPIIWHKSHMDMRVISSPDIYYSLSLPNANKTTVNGGLNFGFNPSPKLGKKRWRDILVYAGGQAKYGEGWGYLIDAGIKICF